MFKGCFITLLLGLFSPICAVFAAQPPEIQARWKSHISLGSAGDAEAFVSQRYPGLTFSRATGPALERFKNILVKVDLAYRELFPDLMRNKTFPDFVIFESADWENLQVLNETDLHAKYNQGVFMVSSALLKELESRGEAAVVGLVAHELAHLYLHHLNINHFILDAWDAKNGRRLSKTRLKAFGDFLRDSFIAGPAFSSAFGGQPLGLSLLRDDFRELIAALAGNYPNEICATDAVNKYRASIVPLYKQNFSELDGEHTFRDYMDELVVRTAIEDFQSELLNCSRKVGFKGRVLEKRTFDFHSETLPSSDFISLRLGKPFKWSGQDELPVLLELSKKIHMDMSKIHASHRLQDIHWLSFEDEADDFAIAVMRKLGLRAEHFTGMLLELLEKVRAGSQMSCRASIAAGIEIPYGDFTDPHHGICWRVREFERRFNAGTDRSSRFLKSE